MSVEREFYRRHSGGLALGSAELQAFEREKLAPGKRYGLVTEAFVRTPPSGVLVELGCGAGAALMIYASRHAFERVVGIDIAANDSDGSLGIEYYAANLNEDWPFGDGQVDHLIAMMLIEHLFDPMHSFGEIRRVLARGGKAYVNLPVVTGVKNRLRLLFGRLPVTSVPYDRWFERGKWDGAHLHYFSVPSIHDLARASGLRVTAMRGVGAGSRLKTMFPTFLAGEVTFQLEHAGGGGVR